MNLEKVCIICPTYNAGELWKEWIAAVKRQTAEVGVIFIVDSGSSDETVLLSKAAGFEIKEIPNSTFNHGRTRNEAANDQSESSDFFIFLTQDAILNDDNAIENILKPFEDTQIGAVCGRQLPHTDADPIATHSRNFNYKSESRINSKSDIESLGLKTAYMSNSFAAYRKSAFQQFGGFPEGLIFGEDMYLAAKMILGETNTAYSSESKVRHSHNYTLKQEFKRYFDIGVFHTSQPFLLESFGKPKSEGFKYAISEAKFSLKNGGLFWFVNSIIRTGFKFLAYNLGKRYLKLPLSFCKKLSMDRNFWNHLE